MSELCDYNCEALEDHEVVVGCAGARPAGVSDILFALCGHSIVDPSDGTQWTTALNANFAKELFSVAAGFDSGEPTLSPKTTACGLPSTLFVTYTGTITDYNFTSDNVAFYNTLINGYKIPAMLMRLCPKSGWDDQSLWLDGEISFTGSPVVPNTDEETARFEITWSFKGDVTLVDTPSGLFS